MPHMAQLEQGNAAETAAGISPPGQSSEGTARCQGHRLDVGVAQEGMGAGNG